ncbi:FAD-binding oxidoreductase [Aspergillus saccharolyticus JOP 1030-1]|uniref:D-lactate dehydrogenase n=1 Tax=Aspergillus saccharolyticus JOP 1030-1 TaxID=1450539 RepID=A0A318Z1G5_9EURO|nr:D-lactate dehydrogenase [Aspergillus saccharolyticus JOP 1030-1]PYH40846.1 D-lactate dehydrogenase [Aspergillus saccharolyticus JOP 1030-1]
MTDSQLTILETWLSSHPAVQYTPRTSPSFADEIAVWNAGRSKSHIPLAAVKPRTFADVGALIHICRTYNIPFTFRAGGHNIEGKALHHDALLIDLRGFDSVRIAPDRKSATVGGGILQGKLGETLWKEGLFTPTGSIADVGYVGWSTYGGYGLFTPHWGLGVDQILGAKVVKADGMCVDTDKEEGLLQGIKGAGGAFGAIVEVRVRVYEMKKLLSGVIMFESSNIRKTFVEFNAAFHSLQSEGLPDELAVQQFAINAPPGRLFGTIFVWSGEDLDEGRRWADRIAHLGIPIMNTVAPTSIPDWYRGNGAMVPTSVYGSSRTANVRRLTPELAEVIGQSLERMPADPATMLSIHELRGPSATSKRDSVFAAREPHFMLEILGCVVAEGKKEAAEQWASETLAQVHGTEAQNLLPGAYVSLHYEGDQKMCAEDRLQKLFGEFADAVGGLKEKYDPSNVFALAVPKLK